MLTFTFATPDFVTSCLSPISFANADFFS
jgi:hypothetical protein